MFQLGEWRHRIGSTFCLRCTIVPNSCHRNNIVRQSFLPLKIRFKRWPQDGTQARDGARELYEFWTHVVFHRWSCRNPFGPSCPLTKWHQLKIFIYTCPISNVYDVIMNTHWLHWFWQIEYHIRKELFRKFQHRLCSSIVLFVFWQHILQRWHHHNRHISCIVSRFCKF